MHKKWVVFLWVSASLCHAEVHLIPKTVSHRFQIAYQQSAAPPTIQEVLDKINASVEGVSKAEAEKDPKKAFDTLIKQRQDAEDKYKTELRQAIWRELRKEKPDETELSRATSVLEATLWRQSIERYKQTKEDKDLLPKDFGKLKSWARAENDDSEGVLTFENVRLWIDKSGRVRYAKKKGQ